MSVNILAIVEIVVDALNAILQLILKIWPSAADNVIVLDIQNLLAWLKGLPVPATALPA